MFQPWTKNAVQRRVYQGQEATVTSLSYLRSKSDIEAARGRVRGASAMLAAS